MPYMMLMGMWSGMSTLRTMDLVLYRGMGISFRSREILHQGMDPENHIFQMNNYLLVGMIYLQV